MPSLPRELESALRRTGQATLLAALHRLDPAAQAELVRDLSSLDFQEVERLRALLHEKPAVPTGGLAPLPEVVKGADPAADARARAAGLALLREGKVAAFVVAGGQGTRLGHPGPKGTFAATPVIGKPLFRVFAEKLRALGRRVGRAIPWYVMTSPENDAETRRFFAVNRHFGLAEADVVFFTQGTMPAMSAEGELLRATPSSLFRSPDGHGGSLRALRTSGALDDLARRGVEEIFYFQVDNPLVQVCDPVFLGYHAQAGSEFSSKAVPKRDPGEKVGILVSVGGRPGVIEYSDLPPELREAREPSGALRFRAGNIAIHAIKRRFVERLTDGVFRLPFHLARKDIPSVDPDGRTAVVKGTKFETFVFDALPLAEQTMVMSVRRDEEFSPIKNREGEDSPASSLRDQQELHVRWLAGAGVSWGGRNGDGTPARLEISPLFALDAEELRARAAEIRLDEGDVVLDET